MRWGCCKGIVSTRYRLLLHPLLLLLWAGGPNEKGRAREKAINAGLMSPQLLQHPRILPADTLHHISRAKLLGQDVECVCLDLEVRADATAQFVEKLGVKQNRGRTEDASVCEEQRHVEMHADFLHVAALVSLANRIRHIVPSANRAVFEQRFGLVQIDRLIEILERLPSFRDSGRDQCGAELDLRNANALRLVCLQRCE